MNTVASGVAYPPPTQDVQLEQGFSRKEMKSMHSGVQLLEIIFRGFYINKIQPLNLSKSMAANFKTYVRVAILPTSTSSYIVSNALPQGPVESMAHPHRVHPSSNKSIEKRFYRLGTKFGWKHRATATGHAKIPLSVDSSSGNVNTNDLSLVIQLWRAHILRRDELIGVGVVPLREVVAELSDLSSRSYRSSLPGVLPGGLAGIALDKFIALTSTQNPSHSLGLVHLILRVPQAIPNEYWFAQRNQALNMNLPLVESTTLEPAKSRGLASQVNQPTQMAGQPSYGYAAPGAAVAGAGMGAAAGAGIASGHRQGQMQTLQQAQQPLPQAQLQGQKHYASASGIDAHSGRHGEQNLVPPSLNYASQSGQGGAQQLHGQHLQGQQLQGQQLQGQQLHTQQLQTQKQPLLGAQSGAQGGGQQVSGLQSGVYNPASYTNVYHPGPQGSVSSVQQSKESVLQDVRSMFRPEYDRTTFGGNLGQVSGQQASEYAAA